MFQYNYFVSFDKSDPAGLMFSGNYLTAAHEAIEQFIVERGIPWKDWFDNSNFAVPLVHSSTDFKAPIPAGSQINISVKVSKLGSSSIGFQCLFLKGDVNCAELSTVHVFIDKSNGQKINIPEEIKNKFA